MTYLEGIEGDHRKCAELTGLNLELMVTYVNQVDLQDLVIMFWIKKGCAYIAYPIVAMLSIPLNVLKFVMIGICCYSFHLKFVRFRVGWVWFMSKRWIECCNCSACLVMVDVWTILWLCMEFMKWFEFEFRYGSMLWKRFCGVV